MKNPWTILAEIAATDSKNEKQSLLKVVAEEGNDTFFKGIRVALDPMITLGVKKVPESKKSGPGLQPSVFFDLCKELAERKLTGDAAQDAIQRACDLATTDEWNGWYRLVLIKDLKAGFSESTVNKVCEKNFPKYAIPVFEVQLAKDCVDDEGNVDEALFCGKKLIDVKLDGMRCMTIVYPNGKVDQYSRNGKELVNFSKIKSQIAAVAGTFFEPMVIDGEVMSASFQDLMKQAKRKTNVQADDSVLNVFDMLPLSEFLAGKSTTKQKVRTKALATWFSGVEDQLPNVTVVGTELVDLDTDAGKARLLEINQLALNAKVEGIMLKDPDAFYECKRSLNWMKMKPFITVDLKVVDVEEGKADSKFVGTMGALVCEGVDQGRKIRVNVGGGYSIQLRAQIWAMHTGKPVEWKKKEKGKWVTYTEQPGGTVVGQTAEIKADAVTKSESKDEYSLRFPRFLRFRDDK